LKIKLKNEGNNHSYENFVRLKLPSSDGKYYKTDVADTKQILRIIQSIPSPNAEPFKQWLANLGHERLNEIADPQIAVERAVSMYRKKGYSEDWIKQRMKTTEFRNDLTAEWNRVGVREGLEYSLLTDEISKAWSGMSTKEYKQFKNIKKENLRDNMTNMELVLNMLAEATTTELSKTINPDGFNESKIIAKEGGNVAKNTKNDIENRLGRSVISSNNARDNPRILDDNINLIDNNNYSVAEEINKFYDLKKKGIISDDEFEAKKKELLNMDIK
jgi:hypothetical protein